MPDNVGLGILAGLKYVQVAILDADGYPVGLNTSDLAAGAGAGLYRAIGAKSANPQLPESERVPIMGDEAVMGTFMFPPGSHPQFDLTMATFDFDMAAAFEDVKKVTLGDWDLSPLGATDVIYKDSSLLLSSHMQSKETGSDGLSGWFHLAFPRCQFAYRGTGQVNQRGEIETMYSVTISPSNVYPWGHQCSIADEGTERPVGHQWTTTNPVTMHTFVGNDVITDLVLDETPTETLPAGGKLQVFRDGVVEAASAITPGTKTVTLSSALLAGEHAVVVYEYQP